MLSPTAARVDIGLLIAVRVFQGLCQGLTLPAFYSMVQKWLPELERNKIMPKITAGNVFVTCLMPYEVNLAAEYIHALPIYRTTTWADFELPDQQHHGRKVWLGVRVLHVWERWLCLVYILGFSHI